MGRECLGAFPSHITPSGSRQSFTEYSFSSPPSSSTEGRAHLRAGGQLWTRGAAADDAPAVFLAAPPGCSWGLGCSRILQEQQLGGATDASYKVQQGKATCASPGAPLELVPSCPPR